MAAVIVKRATFDWSHTQAKLTQTNMGMVVHFDGRNKGMAKKPHAACVNYWKGVRIYHMENNGWLDIGYSYGVCPHGEIFEGRGYNRQQAAELPTPGKMQYGNSRWVSCSFMSSPGEHPTPAQITAFQQLRKQLMGKGMRSAVLCHSDFSDTDCPGTVLREMVRSKSILKAITPPEV